jgi:hypothetical protein
MMYQQVSNKALMTLAIRALSCGGINHLLMIGTIAPFQQYP